MRHLKFIVFMMAAIMTQAAFSQEIPDCEESAKPLYKDILIYRATEKLKPGSGIVGARLQADIGLIRTEMSLSDKVHSIETGFVKCYLRFSALEEQQIDKEIQAAKEKVLQQN